MASIEQGMLEEVEMESLTAAEAPAPKQSRKRGGMAIAKVVVAVALGLAVVTNVRTLPQHRAGRLSDFEQNGKHQLTLAKTSGVTMLDEEAAEDPCKDEPQLIMTKIKHNNLGKKGPGTGDEGMVFEGTYLGKDGASQDVELHVNVVEDSDEFKPSWPDNLGFHGGDKFMSINLKPGSEVKIEMKVTELGKEDPVTLPVLDLSFFDLDKHEHGNAEYVKVRDEYGHLLYEGTELTDEDSGHWTTFKATKLGTGSDNPTDPLDLTEQQLQRAVTVEFRDFTSSQFILGNDDPDNTHGRRFDFIGKPALKCAMGVDHNKIHMVINSVPQCCIVKIMSFGLMCVNEEDKQFYHFMCDPVEEE